LREKYAPERAKDEARSRFHEWKSTNAVEHAQAKR
jgi:hypothetical protein